MRRICAVILCVLLLCGCSQKPEVKLPEAETTETETTIPPDGNAKDVTCKGSYTRQGDKDTVVARVGDAELTNGQLAVWYYAEAAQMLWSDNAPDFSRPFDQQRCTIDTSVASWQQYFLRQALNQWHTAAALNQQSKDIPLPTEEEYQPDPDKYAKYMTGMPAAEFLYGYHEYYTPNTMHQAYLDALPEMLDTLAAQLGCKNTETLAKVAFGASVADVLDMAELFNRAYMYFTTLTYDLSVEEAEAVGVTGAYNVDFRHILLTGEGSEEEILNTFKSEARKRYSLLAKKDKYSEAMFGDLARMYSQDSGTAVDGGAYRNIRKGQLDSVLDAWCFAPERQPGDTIILDREDGVHILYFSGKTDVAQQNDADAELRAEQAALLEEARKAYPMEVSYADIALPEANSIVSAGELLYPDIAHERFPEVPLYLQQDYPKTMFGDFPIRTNGCGITSMAMLASYMTDEEWTPPEMCARYGNYSHNSGTDGMIFIKEPPVLGFYFREKTHDPSVAWNALEEGHLVISIQHKGYWTRGGHYIVLEKLTDDGLVQVRDSNLYNYERIEAHIDDQHTWRSITSDGSGYWIFNDKTTRIPLCTRCGDSQASGQLVQEYLCHKCAKAMRRRDVYLAA